jgi:hypothetical protein
MCYVLQNLCALWKWKWWWRGRHGLAVVTVCHRVCGHFQAMSLLSCPHQWVVHPNNNCPGPQAVGLFSVQSVFIEQTHAPHSHGCGEGTGIALQHRSVVRKGMDGWGVLRPPNRHEPHTTRCQKLMWTGDDLAYSPKPRRHGSTAAGGNLAVLAPPWVSR